MPRPADPAVRERLIDVAVDLLARDEEVTLRKVATAAGTSTMGVYTHFDGMAGLLYAVRERAFAMLAEELLALRLRDIDSGAEQNDRAVREHDLRLQQELASQRSAEAALEKQREFRHGVSRQLADVQAR